MNLFVFLLAIPLASHPGAVQQDTPLAYPLQADLEVLVPVADGTFDGPLGFRFTTRRRMNVRLSISASALYLSDPLTRLKGGSLGGAFTVPIGPLLVEPFLEVGGGQVDDRIDRYGYAVWEDGVRRWIPRYSAEEGWVWGGGGGVAIGAVLGRSIATRLSVGYWKFTRGDLGLEGIEIGAGIGFARHDPDWLRLQRDTIAPDVFFIGDQRSAGDSVRIVGGGLYVLASDENGIKAVVVDGESRRFGSGADATGISGLPSGAVATRIEVHPPPSGQVIRVAVEDSAGVVRSVDAVAFGRPDRTGPTVRLLEERIRTDGSSRHRGWLEVVGLAEDRAGIADASLNGCPLQVIDSVFQEGGAPREQPGAQVIRGGGPVDSLAELVVRDRQGNATRVEYRIDGGRPRIVGGAPEIVDLVATSWGTDAEGFRRVWVRGRVRAESGIAAVTAEGRAAVLHPDSTGVTTFDGWLRGRPTADSVVIEVTARGGASIERRIPLTIGVTRPRIGRLHVFALVRDSAHADSALQYLDPPLLGDGRRVVAMRPVTEGLVHRAYADLVRSMEPNDGLLIYLDGVLTAGGWGDRKPAVQLDRSSLPLEDIAEMARVHPGAYTLVATRLDPGRRWRALPSAPGIPPPAGCVDRGTQSRVDVVSLGSATLSTIADALESGDHDGDGLVRIGEILDRLGMARGRGLLSFDPFTPVRTVGGSR